MTTHLLIIDPQNDFCDIPGAALPVVGANADMVRLAAFMARNVQAIHGITVTLDSHASVGVERTTFWCTGDGKDLAPFTRISYQDVANKVYMPRNAQYTARVLVMLEQMKAQSMADLVVWPVHCVTGSWGQGVHADVMQQLNAWEMAQQKPVRKVSKGEHILTEHFGAFEAQVPDPQVASTCFNTDLARAMTGDVDLLLIAGEASSHCVAASVDQLLAYLRQSSAASPQIILLGDCMSAVAGFASQADAFFARAEAAGARRMALDEAQRLLDKRP